jgi:hypothetical protein
MQLELSSYSERFGFNLNKNSGYGQYREKKFIPFDRVKHREKRIEKRGTRSFFVAFKFQEEVHLPAKNFSWSALSSPYMSS